MKKVLSLVLIMVIMSMGISVQANITLGNALYTDIVTYINHYPIPSYNFNGMTLIAAEDLNNYGFYVFWNEYANTLTIERIKEKTEINTLLTFRPPEKDLGKKELAITSTDVRVFTGNYRYTAFGGLDGKTLINVEDLSCIDNVSVVWEPTVKAVKVWVEDGLEMSNYMFDVRRLDNNAQYYTSCQGFNPQLNWQWYDSKDAVILTLAETFSENSDMCTECYGTLKITDVVDASGQSRLKNKYCYENGRPTLVPYFYGYSDFLLSHVIVLDNDDLYPNTCADHGGLIKFEYSCVHGAYTNDTIRVECLPYGTISGDYWGI